MKHYLRNIIVSILSLFASYKLQRSGARIIGITGSVGKTSTKDAISLVLSKKHRLLGMGGGYNTEIGLPLLILGITSPMSSSPLDWIKVLFEGVKNMFNNTPYDYFIAEMGVDAPGDMDVLLRLLKPHIAVLTSISAVHLAPGQFTSVDDILAEKQKIFSLQEGNDIAIINKDDALVATLEGNLKARTYSYGLHNTSLQIRNVGTSLEGTSFTASIDGETSTFTIPVLGEYHAHIVAPAIIIGHLNGYTMEEMAKILSTYTAPKGRMRLIEGIKETIIIDGSYNASALAMKKGIDMLSGLETSGRKIACLGNMNELGTLSASIHEDIGAYTAGKADVLIAVAKDAKILAESAVKHGFPKENVHFFEDSMEAGKYLASHLQRNDVLFVKGSQNGVRMERMIKEIMKYPEKAKDILVRQSKEWTNS